MTQSVVRKDLDQVEPKIIDGAIRAKAALFTAKYLFDPFRKPMRVNRIGRNKECPCGSGKKYKKCCGRNNQIEGNK